MKLLGALVFLTVMLLVPWETFQPAVNQVINLVSLWLGVVAMLGVPIVFVQSIINGLRERQIAKD